MAAVEESTPSADGKNVQSHRLQSVVEVAADAMSTLSGDETESDEDNRAIVEGQVYTLMHCRAVARGISLQYGLNVSTEVIKSEAKRFKLVCGSVGKTKDPPEDACKFQILGVARAALLKENESKRTADGKEKNWRSYIIKKAVLKHTCVSKDPKTGVVKAGPVLSRCRKRPQRIPFGHRTIQQFAEEEMSADRKPKIHDIIDRVRTVCGPDCPRDMAEEACNKAKCTLYRSIRGAKSKKSGPPEEANGATAGDDQKSGVPKLPVPLPVPVADEGAEASTCSPPKNAVLGDSMEGISEECVVGTADVVPEPPVVETASTAPPPPASVADMSAISTAPPPPSLAVPDPPQLGGSAASLGADGGLVVRVGEKRAREEGQDGDKDGESPTKLQKTA